MFPNKTLEQDREKDCDAIGKFLHVLVSRIMSHASRFFLYGNLRYNSRQTRAIAMFKPGMSAKAFITNTSLQVRLLLLIFPGIMLAESNRLSAEFFDFL